MPTEIDKQQTGLTLGILFTVFHVLWVIIVGIGLAKGLADWMHSIHFLEETHVITPFSLATAVIGIIVAFISGYVLGLAFAVLWNFIGEKLK